MFGLFKKKKERVLLPAIKFIKGEEGHYSPYNPPSYGFKPKEESFEYLRKKLRETDEQIKFHPFGQGNPHYQNLVKLHHIYFKRIKALIH